MPLVSLLKVKLSETDADFLYNMVKRHHHVILMGEPMQFLYG